MTDAVPLAEKPIEILIAEDSRTQALQLRHFLQRRGYTVSDAPDGRLALEAAHRRRPALIISDVNMPHMDGYELCRHIKADPALRTVPVILVTTMSGPEDLIRALECSAEHFITKPYNEPELMRNVDLALLNRTAPEAEPASAPGEVEFYFNGLRHTTTADRQQILALLLSSYEAATRRKNEAEVLAVRLEEGRQRIAEQNLELERAAKLKSQFLANMSHELRTPLNAVIGFSELLKDGLVGTLDATQLDCMNEIYESGRHLLALVNDILDLSKIEAGKVEMEIETLDIEPLLASSLSIVKQRALKENIRLVNAVPADVGSVQADGRRLRQIVYNLLSNAVKFTPSGGLVTLEACVVGEFVEIAVRDSGIGIAAEHLPRLFQPFVQLDGEVNRRFEGTGLGLAMVKSLVELHGGTIGAESELGIGSRFWVRLPRGA